MAHSLVLTTLLFTLLINITILNHKAEALKVVDPTDGFVSLPLNQSNFEIQRPYDVPVDQRYSYVDGVHKMWVFKTDKPHFPNSNTKPRTEIRIQVIMYNGAIDYFINIYTKLWMNRNHQFLWKAGRIRLQ